MKRRVVGSLLSFLLAFTLILPAVGAQEGISPETGGAQKIISKLDPKAISLDVSSLDQNVTLEKPSKTDTLKSAKRQANGLQIEKIDTLDEAAIQPQNYVPLSDSTERISVIVELQSEPVKVFEASHKNLRIGKSAISHQLQVKTEQDTFKKSAIKRLNVDIDREYSEVFNGFSLEIAADEVEDLLNIPGVKAIYPNNTVYALEEPVGGSTSAPEGSVPFIGSEAIWSQGVKGAGIKVGVIDTGIAHDHPDLVGTVDPNNLGYDFVNNDNDPYETTRKDYDDAHSLDPSLPEMHPVTGKPYWTAHGSHVSGVIAGRGVGKDGQPGITGVAPEAEIHAYKVLGPYGSGSTANVIAGIERAVQEKMDVINLSLGSETNNERSADSVAVNNAMATGTITVVSNGNSGPADATVTDPGTAELVISVGASKPPLVTPILKIVGSDGEFKVDSFDKSEGIEKLTGSYQLVDVGLGKPENYVGKDLSGKIAFIKRGEMSFTDKALNAINAGAAAAIVYNNAPEALESGTLGDVNITIPVYALSGTYGNQIKAKLDTDPSIQVNFTTTIEKDIIAGFSSRGPSKPSYAVKPDISAPGIGIRSSVTEYEGWYEAQNGTSMAAPHIAGAAALLRAKYTNLDQYDIKSLLMNNAVKLIDRDGNRYTHMDQGAGRVDLNNVLKAKAVAEVEAKTTAVKDGVEYIHHTGSFSYGYINYGESAERKVVVTDIGNADSSYSISTQWYGSSPVTLTTSKNVVDVSAGGEESFTVTATVPANAADQRYEGELILTEAGGHVIQLPIAVYVGEVPVDEVVTNLELNPNIFSPNGDTLNDTSNIRFTITEFTEYFSLDVFSVEGKWLGTIVETDQDGIDPGTYNIKNWDGSFNAPSGQLVNPSDDLYLLVPLAGSLLDDPVPVESQVTPFIIDTKAPVSKLDDPGIVVDKTNLTAKITGQVTDDLLIQLKDIVGLEMNDVVGVAAWYDDGNKGQVVDGEINDSGHFTIQVPISIGDNSFEVYVYDVAGNGLIDPAHIVDYKLTNFVAPAISPAQVQPNEPFSLNVAFDVTDAVYSAKFDLLYSNTFTDVEVTPSTELAEHQAKLNPDASLTVTNAVYEYDPELSRHEFSISLNDVDGYRGTGSLTSFGFAGAPAGQYSFKIANLELLDRDGKEIPVEVSDTIELTVKPVQQAELSVSPQSLSIKAGTTGNVSVSYKAPDGSVTDVTEKAAYTVSNAEIATVQKGIVSGKKKGNTDIEITYEGLKATVAVTVIESGSGGENPGTGSGGNGGSGGGGTPTVPTTPTTPPAKGTVKEAIKAGEPTVLKLEGGLTVTIPAGAITSPEAAFVQGSVASKEDTEALLKGLQFGSTIKAFGVYYDFAVLDKDGKTIENISFSKSAEVSIPLETLQIGGFNGEKINLFKIEDKGELSGRTARLVDGKVVAHLNSFSRYMFMAKNIAFTDVTKTNYPWAVNEIEVLASKDIVTGTSADQYTPGKQVTRAEFVSLLVRTLELGKSENSAAQFSDVQSGSWYYDAVQAAVSAGWINGYADHTFAPDQSITRAEMAVILSRVLKHLEVTEGAEATLPGYADQAQIQNWAKAAVAQVAALGIMQGRGETRFAAQENTTRAEAAVVVYRIFKGYTK
ncbi:S8 family serine peptidase [Paenibacillus sp. N3/727]|uniref:S8 family serine peptidase n=1 Tax=Paenibacillus sp. N3/727 TaxID=2925845 RepID=UPI001F535A16|nr:S8 family serine peptidase [Paenibacillus sp. N3/727]UNK16025.1 S8 family serine peptidase [Paenibacillus sp. N3/727]